MDNFGIKSIKSLEFIDKINEGTYGVVYKGRIRETQTIVAIKKIKKKYPEEILDPITLREVAILKDLNHQNVINLLDIIFEENEIFLIYEYMDTDLYNFIYKSKNHITKSLIRDILYKILTGLEYLHSNCIMHRDLKLKNILISKNGHIVKIADFGLSRKINIINANYSKKTGTIYYMAPEILMNFGNYSFSVDVWSVACIFYEMVFKRKLFSGNTYEDQLHEIEIVLGTPNNNNWPNIEDHERYKYIYPKSIKGIIDIKFKELNNKETDLIKKMLVYNPNKRINIKKALSHVSFSFFIILLNLGIF